VRNSTYLRMVTVNESMSSFNKDGGIHYMHRRGRGVYEEEEDCRVLGYGKGGGGVQWGYLEGEVE